MYKNRKKLTEVKLRILKGSARMNRIEFLSMIEPQEHINIKNSCNITFQLKQNKNSLLKAIDRSYNPVIEHKLNSCTY